MSSSHSADSLRQAIAHHGAGRLSEAEAGYRKILEETPGSADAWHLLGVLASQRGNAELAVQLIRRAIALNASAPDYHSNLGGILRESGQWEAGAVACRRALELSPRHFGAHVQLGNILFDQGQVAEAITSYREAILLNPKDPEVRCNLGNALLRNDRTDEAIEQYRKAIDLWPGGADAHRGLAEAFHSQGKEHEAISECQAAVRLAPLNPDAQNQLANMLCAAKNFDEAICVYREALRLDPRHADAMNNLGNAYYEKGQCGEAMGCFENALRMRPGFAAAHFNLGNALKRTGKFEPAVAAYRRAIELDPAYKVAYNNLGNVLQDLWRNEEAITIFRESLRLDPHEPSILNNLGTALLANDQVDESVAIYEESLRSDPQCAATYNNLGNARKGQGRIDLALECFRRGALLDPSAANIQSNIVYSMLFDAASDNAAILAAALEWNARHGAPLKSSLRPHSNDRDSSRKLRIGYLSPDLRRHVIGCNMLPLLRNHDRSQFEIHCYPDVVMPDAITRQMETMCDHWQNIVTLPDEQVAEMIRNDGIDILVDLTLHMARNRLPLFARKPAPIQVTYLGYCGTTGLETMDYRFSDLRLDSPESDTEFYSEETIFLPHSYWCYEPLDPTPASSPLPALTNGFVTFGCLNNFAKVSAAALDLWAELLHSVPESRLLLHANSEFCRQSVRERFAAAALAPERIRFVGMQAWEGYLNSLQEIDIALDPFPYGGGITSCDALWMGVPVVTLAGQTAVGRGGKSILTNVGLLDLIAETPDEYLEIARDLAADLPRLRELRLTLRERMEQSPLRDAAQHAREVEAAYRRIWRNWCANEKSA